MNRVIKILIERDDLTEKEATALFNEVQAMVLESPEEAEDILLEELGLEMDYIMDII